MTDFEAQDTCREDETNQIAIFLTSISEKVVLVLITCMKLICQNKCTFSSKYQNPKQYLKSLEKKHF